MSSYFIKIEDGPELRRKILESSKASVHILRGYQDLLKIRGEKLTHMNHLRTQLKELTVLVNRAESLMPQLSEREVAELQPKEQPKAQMKVVPKAPVGKWVQKGNRKVFIAAPKVTRAVEVEVPTPDLSSVAEEAPKVKPMTELERLEAQLQQIEGKLGNL